MIPQGTNLNVADSSNVKIVKCSKVLGQGSFAKEVASFGDIYSK